MAGEAEKFLAEREADLPGNLLAAKAAFLAEAEGDDAGRAYCGLAETMFWLGEYATSDKEKDSYYKEGVAFGKEAVERLPDEVAAHLWYAANMGQHGVVRGIMSSLFYLKPIEKHALRALELNERYFHGAPLRLMGRFYHQCPGWPIGSGDIKKAIQTLEKAVAIGPGFFLNHLYLADAYIAKYKKPQARELLQTILDSPAPAEWPKYHLIVCEQARALLRKT